MKDKAEKFANKHGYTIVAKPKQPTMRDIVEAISGTYEEADKKLEELSKCCKKNKEEDVR